MNRSITYSFFLLLIIFTGCRKEDNPKLPDLVRVPTPLLVKDEAADQFISPVNPAGFKGKFTVDLFFKTDVPPQKMDVVIRKNGGATKVYKAGVTSFPSVYEITGQELITLFGEDIEGGDMFEIGVDITTREGQVFQAFPATGAPYGSGIFNQPGVNTSISFMSPCEFDADAYAGDFKVITDEWEDYSAGDIVTVKKINENQISFEYAAADAQPIILDINKNNNAITVARQYYGNYGAGFEIYAESVAGDASAVNPCDLSLSVRLKHTSPSGGNYGTYTIRLKKK